MGSNKSTKKRALRKIALVAKVLEHYHSNPLGGHSGVNSWAR